MTRRLRFTLLGDGSSDEALNRHIEWLIRENVATDVAVDSHWADLRAVKPRPEGLRARIERTLDLYPSDLLFVHRDAEKESAEKRFEEILQACSAIIGISISVPVVPVRMSEAWLLCDELAIRKAAGNPNGDQPLNLPRLSELEKLPDPKNTLQNALRCASGLTGRRLKGFKPHARLFANYLTDFASLRGLSAFQRLESDLQKVLKDQFMLKDVARY